MILKWTLEIGRTLGILPSNEKRPRKGVRRTIV